MRRGLRTLSEVIQVAEAVLEVLGICIVTGCKEVRAIAPPTGEGGMPGVECSSISAILEVARTEACHSCRLSHL
jgi:hypothetical protein